MYVESAAAEHDERDEAADVVEAIGHADGDLDAAVGLHPWSQRDHHFDDHGAVAVARHSRGRRHRRIHDVDDVHDSAYGMPTRPRFVGVRGMSIQVFPIFGLVK